MERKRGWVEREIVTGNNRRNSQAAIICLWVFKLPQMNSESASEVEVGLYNLQKANPWHLLKYLNGKCVILFK